MRCHEATSHFQLNVVFFCFLCSLKYTLCFLILFSSNCDTKFHKLDENDRKWVSKHNSHISSQSKKLNIRCALYSEVSDFCTKRSHLLKELHFKLTYYSYCTIRHPFCKRGHLSRSVIWLICHYFLSSFRMLLPVRNSQHCLCRCNIIITGAIHIC